jgi:hypothetical protein
VQHKEVCRRLAEAREVAGLTQEGLAQNLTGRVGYAVTARDVQRFERSSIPWELLDDIGRVTGASTAWLLYGGDEPDVAGSSPPPPHRVPSAGRAVAGLLLGLLAAIAVERATGSLPVAVIVLLVIGLGAVLRPGR